MLLDATSDINKATLSSAGIGDISQEAFSANESGIFSICTRSSTDGRRKFFYLKSVDSIKRATKSEEILLSENLVDVHYNAHVKSKKRS